MTRVLDWEMTVAARSAGYGPTASGMPLRCAMFPGKYFSDER
jgi:hypothetical protein